ncbi:hypothetical protein GCM10027277_53960 [Pseudoduganella ginsengisoli]|uniref:DUF4154 domain-containing protein n=1 Tax=Pseudoduganella ginsengisoli TaxID=1462440 RepID=A0A6L6Q2C7_9BURK|nr:YfiR family protein [Pseudoduganella ginsengisoli]MTW03388.1 DUF4154 domain-containing protein [Pseudoduganella ginsengisoli]
MAILSASLNAAGPNLLIQARVPAPAPHSRSLLALLALLCSTLMVALSCLAVGADAPSVNGVERGVKAAFLYKFLGYVEYPQDTAPLVVGVVGADDIGAELARITSGRNVGGRPVTVRMLRDGDAVAGLHMLFIGADAPRSTALLRSAQQQGVLTVTESDNGLQQGSVINFRLVEERVRFEVSLPAAEKSGLKLSSRLLSVAYHVLKGSQ